MLRTADKRLLVGTRLVDVITPGVAAGVPPQQIFSPMSPEFSAYSALAVTALGSTPTSVAWFTANKPMALSFSITRPLTVYRLGWTNGSGTMTDSVDVGVYDSTWNRKISTGSTARSGVSTIQWVDVTDTPIPAGRYYLAMSNNGTTAAQQLVWAGLNVAAVWGLAGNQDSATDALPLPDPLTNMAATATCIFCPVMFIAARATV